MKKPIVCEHQTVMGAADYFDKLKNEDHSFFLDSGMDPTKLGRFSFLGCRPFMVMKSWGKRVKLLPTFGKSQIIENDPFEVLRDLLGQYRYEDNSKEIPFTGGAVGYLSYDLGRLIERLPQDTEDDLCLPECYLAFYDSVIAFDHLKNKKYLIAQDEAGIEKLRDLIERNKSINPSKIIPYQLDSELKSNFSRENYIKAVEKTREYILAGDIFQANISQRFEASITIPPYELYRRLRTINPAPFAAYLNFNEIKVISASPECFLKVNGDKIQTRPIKGTRPRGKTTSEDESLARNLLSSIKDRAENIMIVDLERNDLGRVSEFGSVRVTELAILENYPTVFHLTSTIESRLKSDKDLIDLLRATFPGGSITGAPKVRAMEIIEELEPTRRNVYTGSIGYIDFRGGMELNIAIRTIILKENRAFFQVGGGIVFDSEPEAEYQETIDKARALIEAVGF